MVTGRYARIASVVVIAAGLAAADLVVKQAFPADELYLHSRSQLWVALSVVVLAGAVALTLLPSRFIAVASGVLAGGVLGNLIWARWHDGVVANPFVVTSGDTEIAFNLADVFVLAGILLEMAALIILTIRYRHLLPPGHASRARQRPGRQAKRG